MKSSGILVRPVITERATTLKDRFNQIVFEVQTEATKPQIKDAVESTYGVTVEQVRTTIVHGKFKRRGAAMTKQPNWKKAVVTLKKGDTIDFFATE